VRVRIDRDARALHAEALQVIGTLDFESDDLAVAPRSAGRRAGVSGVLRGAELVGEGCIGRALAFAEGGSGARAVFGIEASPAWDFRDGFRVELELFVPKDGAGSANLLHVGEVIGLQLTSSLCLRGWFTPEVEAKDGKQVAGPPVLVEGTRALALGRWVQVALAYDRSELVLEADGVPLARFEEQAPVWRVERPMVLGDERRPFAGRMDGLVVAAVVAGERAVLPQGVAFVPDVPSAVCFAPGGALDRRRHPSPVEIGVVHADGKSDRIQVGSAGTVDG
jgi:hypothetical protein